MSLKIAARDFSLRCAKEPQQTASATPTSFMVAGLHSIVSQATFSTISYCGTPASFNDTSTLPVGKILREIYPKSSPVSLSTVNVSSPSSSSPIAVTGYDSAPNSFAKKQKLIGAPPSLLPSGKQSQTTSPIPIIFMVL